MTLKKKWGLALVIIGLVAIIVPSFVLSGKTNFVYDGDSYAWDSYCSPEPPFDFVRADNLLQASLTVMETRGLTTGPINPYFGDYGDMSDHYTEVSELQAEVHEWAVACPDSATANSETVLARLDEVQGLMFRFNSLPRRPILQYYFFNKGANWSRNMSLALYCLILGLIWYKRTPEEASHVC